MLQEELPIIKREVEKAVKRVLGEEFDVLDFQYYRGSLEIWVVIGAIYFRIGIIRNGGGHG
jgi:hypothetical protein